MVTENLCSEFYQSLLHTDTFYIIDLCFYLSDNAQQRLQANNIFTIARRNVDGQVKNIHTAQLFKFELAANSKLSDFI